MLTRLPVWLAALACAALIACDDDPGPAEGLPHDAAVADGGAADATADGGAADALAPDAAPAPRCAVTQRWALDSDEIELWPDPRLLVEDPSTASGYRLDPDAERVPWMATPPRIVGDTLNDLGALSGFARTGAVLFRFTAPVIGVPSGAEATLAEDAAVAFLDLSTEPPTRVPFQVETGEDGAAVILVPNEPLKPATRYAVAFGPQVTAADGGCVDAAPVLRAALDDDAEVPGLAREWLDAVEAAVAFKGWSNGSLVAGTAFITQDERGPILAAAESLVDRDYAWEAPPTCEVSRGTLRCEGAFAAFDFRDDRAITTAEPQPDRWRLPVSLWLPTEGEGPFPTVVFGHGINGQRQGASSIANVLVPRGFAVVSIDAVRHGEHPTATGEGVTALAFLGLDLSGPNIDGFVLRGHFNQTVLDRLQLIELIRQAPDLDGDGAPELDPTRLGYWGNSLGSLYGAGILALSADLGAGVLSVGGGRLMAFVTETALLGPFRPALNNLAGGADRLQRYLVVLQTLVDAADPALWAAHVRRDRMRGDAPHVLLPVCLEDDTVPPLTGRTLARALGVPHVAPVMRPVDGLPVVEAPVSASVGDRTGGYFQLDRSGDPPVAATHGNTPTGLQGALQAGTFFSSWLDGDAVIIDPYAELDTPPLP